MPASLRGVAVEAAQLRKGDFFDFKGKRCVVMKASQQINNRKAFAIVEFREVESGNKHKETIQAGDKVHSSGFNFLIYVQHDHVRGVPVRRPLPRRVALTHLALSARGSLKSIGRRQSRPLSSTPTRPHARSSFKTPIPSSRYGARRTAVPSLDPVTRYRGSVCPFCTAGSV